MLENRENNVNFLPENGKLTQLVESVNWADTSIGSPEEWPQSLRSALGICFNSNFPIAIYWGKELVLLYNEAWSSIPGAKHPWAFGKNAMNVWPEIWKEIQPQFEKAFNGVAGGSKDALLPMQRHGYTEECYFDFTFTPIHGETGRVEGIFNAVIETTYRVINERRAGVLQRLTDAINGVTSSHEIYLRTSSVFEGALKDIPFFMIYEMVSNVPLLQTKSASVDTRNSSPFSFILESGTTQVLENLDNYLSVIPEGGWPEPPREAIIIPLRRNDGNVSGFLVAGVSSRRALDNDYKSFYESLAKIIGGELNTLRSLTEERERAEQLKQLDKAKTIFFSNISHEFRTPLTLMLSPLEEVLNSATELDPEHRHNLETSLRNTLRLQKLVNTLLDFSRIEAGRMDGKFEYVDLSLLTSDLSSAFRDAIEVAGLQYNVSIHNLKDKIPVDVDMWEKIVLNLISNAFKYTERGKIDVELRDDGDWVILTVSDTGVGIAEEHLERIFQRFYRVGQQGGRSQEGTGIGLAMVKELVHLHGGKIEVKSQLHKGSSFIVRIPSDNRGIHIHNAVRNDKDVDKTRLTFINETSIWTDARTQRSANGHSGKTAKPKILVADDNNDMREYISRLLRDDFDVHGATNGEHAFLLALEIAPDLILSDIMMPKLDGLGLLEKLRANLITRNIPVIFLSARAGEDARIDGIRSGADDYLVKPFSAKELLARVSNQIAISKVRRETEKEFFRVFLQLPAHVHVFKGPEHVVEFFHPLGKKFIGRDITGMKIREALPELAGQGYFELLDGVYQSGETVSIPVSKAVLPGPDGTLTDYYFSITYLPWRDNNEKIQGVLQFTFDVTEQTKVNLKIQESEERFRILANSIPQFVWIADAKGNVEFISDQWEEFTGVSSEEGKKLFSSLIHSEDVEDVRAKWKESMEKEIAWKAEFRLKDVRTGEYRWFHGHTLPLLNAEKKLVKWIGSATDIHAQKTLNFELEGLVAERTSELIKLNNLLVGKNEELAKAQGFLRTVLDASVELVTAFDSDLNFTFVNKRISAVSSRKPEDIVGKNLLEIDPGIKSTEGYEYLQRALKGEVVHIPTRRPLINDMVVFETFVIPLKHNGQVTGVVTMQRDITKIITLTEDLKRSNEQLRRSNDDLQQFAHVTSHDLKEPVRKIKMYGNMLSSSFADLLPDKGKDYVARIEKAAARISAMIDGVLQYSTVEVSDQEISVVDLNEVVRNILEDLEIPIKECDARIEFENLPKVTGLPTLLYQLFYNLINNSLKFRRKDLVPLISISASFAKRDTENDGSIQITIRDNGIGFEQNYAERIFDSFTRLNPKDKFEGTGLGLALCRKIVLRHNGTIKANSSRNYGSEFTISFPQTILVN